MNPYWGQSAFKINPLICGKTPPVITEGVLVVEMAARIRRARFVQGKTIKAILRELEVTRNTIRKGPSSWQSAAVAPVQQQDLPPPAPSLAVEASAAAVTQATNDGAGPDGSGSTSQQQADAEQAAQLQATQKAGTVTVAQAAADGTGSGLPSAASPSDPMVAPHPAPDGSGAWTNLSDADYDAFNAGVPAPAAPAPVVTEPATSPVPVSASDLSPKTGSTPSNATASSAAPLLMTGTVAAAGGNSATGRIVATVGDLSVDALGLAARGAAVAGEGLLATVAAPAIVLGGIFWPSSTASDDTLTGNTSPTGSGAAQNNPPDSNAPKPPPAAISPSDQTGSPTGPEGPDGTPTQPSQSAPTQTENVASPGTNAAVTPQEVLADSVPDADKAILKDGTLQQTKLGGMTAADADFDSMQPQDVQIRPGGVRVGVLADGTQVIVRPKSVPSLEINPENGPSYVIRYK